MLMGKCQNGVCKQAYENDVLQCFHFSFLLSRLNGLFYVIDILMGVMFWWWEQLGTVEDAN